MKGERTYVCSMSYGFVRIAILTLCDNNSIKINGGNGSLLCSIRSLLRRSAQVRKGLMMTFNNE